MKRSELEQLREGWDFEAKAAQGGDGKGALPKSVWETYSALANTQGGKILLGAKENKDGTLLFKGIANIRKVEKALWDQLENRQKVSANVLREQDVEVIEVDGLSLLLLHVPKAPRENRPVYLNGQWSETYLRVHEGDRKATRDQARQMLADAVPERDKRVVEGATFTDLHLDSIYLFRGYLAEHNRQHPFLQTVPNELFTDVIGATLEAPDGERRPTWAGLLLLGNERAIQKHVPHWRLSYKDVPEDGSRRWLDRVSVDGTWNANLLQFFRRAVDRLREHVKVPFEINDQGQRVGTSRVYGALREALVNLLTHADHTSSAGLSVVRRGPEVEFANGGLLLVSEAQLWRGGLSQCRNPGLQHLLSIVGIGEREGSGGPTIRQAWETQHWRLPRIEQDFEHSVTRLVLSQESLLPDGTVRALNERFGRDRVAAQDTLGRLILATVEDEGRVNHSRVREICPDVHGHDITKKLTELVKADLIRSSGKTRATTYSFHSGVEAIRPQKERPARVLKFVQEHGKIQRRDVIELLDVTPQVASRILRNLVDDGLLEMRGTKRGAHYVLVRRPR